MTVPVCGRSAAHRHLQEPLQQAARQLDDTLLHAGARRHPADAVLRTAELQTTLQRVLALAHFHPSVHPVHDAGKKLARVWQPLLAGPNNDMRGKLLVYALRLQQQLQAPPQLTLLQGMQLRLHAALAALRPHPASEQEAGLCRIVGQLALLHGLYLTGLSTCNGDTTSWLPVLQPVAPSAVSRHGNALDSALRWQYWLDAAVLNASHRGRTLATALLQPFVQQQLDLIALLCARSDWTLAYYCGSGLASLWQSTLQLLLFYSDEMGAEQAAQLESACLRLHLQGSATAATTSALLRQILRLAQCDASADRGPEPDRPEPARIKQTTIPPELFAAELARYRAQLADFLTLRHATTPNASEALLTLAYKLAWIFDGCGMPALSQLFNTAYQLCRQFWFLRRPLPGGVLRVLRALQGLLDPDELAAVPDGTLRSLRWQLLRQWPDAGDDRLPIALQPADASDAETQEVQLSAVPLLLSGSFATLVQIAQQPLALPLSADRHAALRQELLLLEKGAAAMKVWPLEQLCTLLIDVHARSFDGTAVSAPAGLLDAAHTSLIRLLDEAAAWQEPVADAAVLQALQQWLDRQAGTDQWPSMQAVREGSHAVAANQGSLIGASSEDSLAIAANQGRLAIASEETGNAAARLHASLHAFTRSLAAVVEKPVRLTVDADQAMLDAAALPDVEAAIKPLLKFILLDTAACAHRRREVHKPLVSTLNILLRRQQQQLLVTVSDDGGGLLLEPAQLRQLQRRLPASAGTLDCEVHRSRGRRFSLALQMDGNAQAGGSAWRC